MSQVGRIVARRLAAATFRWAARGYLSSRLLIRIVNARYAVFRLSAKDLQVLLLSRVLAR